jgi:hypothetical protein
VTHEIRPEPTDEERAALEAGLRALAEARLSPYESRWRRRGIELHADDGLLEPFAAEAEAQPKLRATS